jgi:iron(III) transport system permease protein
LDIRHAFLGLTGLIFLAIIVYPLYQVLWRSLIHQGTLSLGNYRAVFSNPANYRALWNSVWVSATSTLMAMVAGTALSIFVVRTDIPMKSVLRILLLLPYGIPPFIGAIAWTQLFGPAGYISKAFMALTGSFDVPWNVYSPAGIVLVMAVYQFPVVFITVSGALGRIDPSLEEAARMSGAGPFRIMRDITMPLVTPSILAGSLLAFVGSISNFGIPALLGFRARFFVLTTRIYSALAIPDMPLATAMAVLLAVTAGTALLLQSRFERGQNRYTVIGGKSVRPQTIGLGKWRIPVFIFVVAVAVLASLVPIVSMIITSFLRYWGAPLAPSSFTTRHFQYIFTLEMVRRALRNSLFLATAAATATMGLGTVVSYMSVKAKMRAAGILDFIGTFPYAVPCTVIAIAMILAWSRAPVMLYGTIWIILAAYLVRYMPFSIRTTRATLQQVHTSLEEAARTSGAGWIDTMRDIVIPLIKPGLVAGWVLVFMPAFRELTMSVLLWSQGTETIGVVIYNMQDAGYTQIAAALSAIVLILILIGNVIVRRMSRGEIGL